MALGPAEILHAVCGSCIITHSAHRGTPQPSCVAQHLTRSWPASSTVWPLLGLTAVHAVTQEGTGTGGVTLVCGSTERGGVPEGGYSALLTAVEDLELRCPTGGALLVVLPEVCM